jgi:hypothetical protein
MSTAFYPTNMRQQPASGFNHGSAIQNRPYIPWKGTGVYKNPIGITSTHIRPLTNMDPGNIFPTGFGRARPLKQYRRGTVIPIHFLATPTETDNKLEQIEIDLIKYNVNRAVRTSTGSSLGGGSGGSGVISQLIDKPGSFIIKDNRLKEEKLGLVNNAIIDNSGESIDAECFNCSGVGLISDWMPINNLTEKPQPDVTNPLLCCNQQRKALRRVLPTNTNIKRNYYQTTYMYLYNRCQTFQQRQFNFLVGPIDRQILDVFKAYPFVTAKILEFSKPGDPLSLVNFYVAQCNPNSTIDIGVEIGVINVVSKSLLEANYITKEDYEQLISEPQLTVELFLSSLKKLLNEDQYKLVIAYLYEIAANPFKESVFGPNNPKGCSQVYYKPNNPQFAKQGGVSSSTRTLKLNVDTISTTAARDRRLRGANAAFALANGDVPATPFLYKDKVPPCQPQVLVGNPFFFSGQHQNKLICRNKTDGSEYHNYNTVNSGSAGNYIGATQNRGAGYTNTTHISNATYFNNLSTRTNYPVRPLSA